MKKDASILSILFCGINITVGEEITITNEYFKKRYHKMPTSCIVRSIWIEGFPIEEGRNCRLLLSYGDESRFWADANDVLENTNQSQIKDNQIKKTT